MAKKILVTGGTGFIGSAITRRLVNEGYETRVFDNLYRSSETRLDDIKSKLNFVNGDIRDLDAVKKAAENVDCILHLAAINGTENFYNIPGDVLEVGVRGMLNVIDACKTHQVESLVVASSSEAYQTPLQVPTDETVPLIVPDVLNPRYSYGGSKIISELLAFHCGKNVIKRAVVFRPHNVYGPDMAWEHVLPQFIVRAKRAIDEKPLGAIPFQIQGDGLQTRAFIHIDDFTEGLLRVIESGEHMNIYHIGNPEEITIKALAEKVMQYLGRDIELITTPPAPGGTLRRCPDISKLKALGFSPQISIDQGLPSIIDWYVANSHHAKATCEV